MTDNALIIKVLRKSILDSATTFVHESNDYDGDPAEAEMALCELIDSVLAYHEFNKPDGTFGCGAQSGEDKAMMCLLESVFDNADSIDITLDGKPVPRMKKPEESPLREILKKYCNEDHTPDLLIPGENKGYKSKKGEKKHKTAKSGKYKK